jgi:uncharacterized protein (DUF1015 family)
MAKIIPFRAIRPSRDKAHLVASRSYVTYKTRHLNRKLLENPYSFIHIINPEFGSKKKTRPNSPSRFKKIRQKFESFCDGEILIQDETPCFYIYSQIKEGHHFTGIICGVDVDEYLNGNIKVHEHTLTPRVKVFSKYLDICSFNAEPVLITYKDADFNADTLLEKHLSERPEYDFTTTNKVRHKLWLVNDPKEIEHIQKEFTKLKCLYIADGHHRLASSAELGRQKKEANEVSKSNMYNYALAMIIPEHSLFIKPFHRVLQLDFPPNEVELLEALSEKFEIKKCNRKFLPTHNREFGMRLPSGWYALKYTGPLQKDSPVAQLDPMILTRNILEPIFGIKDQKTDKRINFIPGSDALELIEKSIDQGILSVLFTLYEVDTAELFAVADAEEVMPPKSTYIEPKLRSGLTIMKLD